MLHSFVRDGRKELRDVLYVPAVTQLRRDRVASQAEVCLPPSGCSLHGIALHLGKRPLHTVAMSLPNQGLHMQAGSRVFILGRLGGGARACLCSKNFPPKPQDSHLGPGFHSGFAHTPLLLPIAPAAPSSLSYCFQAFSLPSVKPCLPSPAFPSVPCRCQHVCPLPLPCLRHHADRLREVRGTCVSEARGATTC